MFSYKSKFGYDPYENHYNEKNFKCGGVYDNSIVLDMIDVLYTILYADLYYPEQKAGTTSNPVSIKVEVENYDLFAPLTDKFENLISFITGGEVWSVNFERATNSKKLEINEAYTDLSVSSIALLSSGLDSLSGAFNEISLNESTMFVTLRSKTEGKKTMANFKFLQESYPNSSIALSEVNRTKGGTLTRSTQRTRTLAFIASTLIYSDFFDIDVIKIYENGIMSLNPSFDERRHVSKTTHHKTLFFLNELLEEIGLNTTVVNPFKFMTKSEVLNHIDENLREIIAKTRTCSKSQRLTMFAGLKKDRNNCGVCIACALRRISISASDLKEFDGEYFIDGIEDTSERSKLKMFHEYKSIKEYYTKFCTEIENGNILYYIDGVSAKYFAESDYLSKLEDMLIKFASEIKEFYNNDNVF